MPVSKTFTLFCFQWHQLCNFEDVYVLPVSFFNALNSVEFSHWTSCLTTECYGTDFDVQHMHDFEINQV